MCPTPADQDPDHPLMNTDPLTLTDPTVEELGPERPKPLAGVRVLDLSRMVAGGIAGMLLADFGADVVKVEQPGTGDPLRQWTTGGEPFWWKVYARNKRYITLNLKSDEGRDAARAAGAAVRCRDGVVRARHARAHGSRLGRAAALASGLILVRISGWGQTGPGSQRPGFGTLVEAASGFAAMNGEPDGAPIVPSFPLADMTSALYAVNAIMFALYHRDVARRRRAGDRRLAVRVAVLAARSVAGGVRRARTAARTQRQPLEERRPARLLSHQRRPLDRRQRLDAEDGGALSSQLRARTICSPIRASPPTKRACAHADELDDAIARRDRSHGRSKRTSRSSTRNQLTAVAVQTVADIEQRSALARARADRLDVPNGKGTVRMHNVVPRLSATPGEIAMGGRRARPGQRTTSSEPSSACPATSIDALRHDGCPSETPVATTAAPPEPRASARASPHRRRMG